ncbi:MAG: hypothetical protein IPM36_20810 [Lewinellaceae bacterium]|nr:hypothetical protein [Lewinellaceae bacterium]
MKSTISSRASSPMGKSRRTADDRPFPYPANATAIFDTVPFALPRKQFLNCCVHIPTFTSSLP